MSIYTGSCLVTCIKTLGGNAIYDLVRIVGGHGVSSSPWQALSLITSNTYLVTASMIVKESYCNDTLQEAKVIYTTLTGNKPDLLSKHDIGSDPQTTPVC